MRDIPALKRSVDLRALVRETHDIERSGKVHCPFHDDRHPSCHVYRDGFKCFACGVYGDHLDWLAQVQGLGIREALERLETLAQAAPPPPPPRSRPRLRDRSFRPVGGRLRERYERALERTRELPLALRGRGLTAADARGLGLAALGDDALLPVRGPDGRLLALKRRYGRPAPGAPRYVYLGSGHGSPAWCSPGATARCESVLVIEGELNGMVAWLALREAGVRIAVVAPAGASGDVYRRVLAGRDVFLYADPDPAGERALERWQGRARQAGARSVTLLPPLPGGDACDVARDRGRPALAACLLAAMFPAPAPGEEVPHGPRSRARSLS